MVKTRARVIIGGKEYDLLDTKKHKNIRAMACVDWFYPFSTLFRLLTPQ